MTHITDFASNNPRFQQGYVSNFTKFPNFNHIFTILNILEKTLILVMKQLISDLHLEELELFSV